MSNPEQSKVACRDECVRAIHAALYEIDEDLAEDMFDGVLRLIAAHVPYCESHLYYSHGVIVQRVDDSEFLSAAIYGHICDLIGSGGNWRLLYRATRDGFSRETFHTLCDGEGPRTVTIALVDDCQDALVVDDQRVVGGFTSLSWGSDSSSHDDSTAFLFCCDRQSDRIKRFPVHPEIGGAVIHSERRGPAFSADLELLNSDGSPAHSSCMVLSYSGEDGGDYDRDSLVGPHGVVEREFGMVREFCAVEIEVFVV